MTFTFDITSDLREVQWLVNGLGAGVERATTRAINKTATSVRAQAAREIQQKRALLIGRIKKDLGLTRATMARQVAVITARGRPIPMREFKPSQTRQGVSVRISKASGRVKLKRNGNKSFQVAKIGNNIFVRRGKARLPIDKWPPVPGIPRVFAQRQVESVMRRTVADRLPVLFSQELNFEIQKAQARARAG
jgi:hypothetical protein